MAHLEETYNVEEYLENGFGDEYGDDDVVKTVTVMGQETH